MTRRYDLIGIAIVVLSLGVAVAIAAAFIGAAVHNGPVPGYAVYAMFALVGGVVGIIGAHLRAVRRWRGPDDPTVV